MLKNVIDFVMSRTQLPRADALMNINIAWKELWNSDDMPNSVFEMSVAPFDNSARMSLPWYVGEIRGVKQNGSYGRERVHLNTPRPWYQDDQYAQSPFLWRVLGTSPLKKSITNASTLLLKFNEPVIAQTKVTLMGPNDNGTEAREQVTFEIGESEHNSVNRYTDLLTCAKDILTPADLRIIDVGDNELGIVPNSAFEAKNTVVQITDRCYVVSNFCRCFDVLYKKACPYLYYDETPVPFEEVLMAKTLEWISMPKDGQEQKTVMFGDKARNLMVAFNGNEVSIDKRLDIGRSGYETRYYGHI